jgi:hypothetical protein
MPTYPEMLRTRERAPTLFFFHCFILGPTFGFLKKFQGTKLGVKTLVKA